MTVNKQHNNFSLRQSRGRLTLLTGGLTLVLLLSACGIKDPMRPERVVHEQPSWVTQLPVRSGHEYGVGSADVHVSEAEAIEQARERARADLLRQIQVSVSSEFNTHSELRMENGQTNRFVEQVNEKIRSRIPEVELPGIGWQAQWQDPDSGTFYVLAHLNRRAAEQQLSERLSVLDLELDEADVPQQGSRLQRVQQALPMLKLFAQRDQLVQQLSFLSESGFSRYQLDDGLKQLRRQLNELVASLQIVLAPDNRQARQLSTGLSAGLAELGLVLNDHRTDQADLTLNYSLQLTDKEVNDTYYVLAFTQLTIRNQQQRILKGFEQQAKGVSGFPERAEQLALQRLTQILAEQIVNTLFSR